MLVPIYEFVKVLSEKVTNPPPQSVMIEEIEKLALANGVFYRDSYFYDMAKFEYLGQKLIANGVPFPETVSSYIGVGFCYT